MNDRGGNGAGCFDVEEWADTTELTNVKAEKDRCSSKMKPRMRAEWVVLRGQFCILASCCLSPMRRISVSGELRVSRLTVIQEEFVVKHSDLK